MSPRRRGTVPEPQRTQLHDAHRTAQTASAELRRAVWAAYQAGASIREIAGELGMSTNTIQQWMKLARAHDAESAATRMGVGPDDQHGASGVHGAGSDKCSPRDS
ncbi:helix-turn-helix domain-containing protein (plasmid) [Mycobacterium avium subsp. hominissuis]|nr:helix-turn-helix domain-containing protein [Mycobacterium avium subsp. hominissuis]